MSKSARERILTQPMLCSTGAPAGRGSGGGPGLVAPGWVYELKLDGVRIIADKRAHDVDLWYRKGRSATRSYPEIARATAALPVKDAVLDGEIIAFDEAGRPSFQRLGQRIGLEKARDIESAARKLPVVYVVFDLLTMNGHDVRARPLLERRRMLEEIVPESGVVRCLDYFEDDGTPLFDMCCRERLEGVVAKRAQSPYRSGERGRDWVKIKCAEDEDFVVVGFTGGSGGRGAIGALDVASYEDGELHVRGKVGSGLDDETMRMLLPRLKALATKGPVARGEYARATHGRTHVRPELVANVRFSSWSDDGRLRHPVFRGIRVDVAPTDCRAAPPKANVSHELAEYYGATEKALLRYLVDRSSIANAEQLRAAAPPLRIRTDGLVVFDADATGALALRRVIEDLGLPAFVKTGEACDYHVLVPVGDAPNEGARAFADLLTHLAGVGVARVAASPVLAPYSPTGGAGSRVSTPLAWTEVKPAFDPKRLTTRTVPARLERVGDPMAPLLDARVNFAAAVHRIEKRIGAEARK